jgi:outer membrane protein OmpA-like peptidoglycan-associated protein
MIITRRVNMKKTIIFSLILLLSISIAFIQAAAALELKGPESADKIKIQSIDESQALISVLDADAKPIPGLQTTDFSITKDGRRGKILSVVPLEKSEKVPMNVVLIVDNSYSMKNRKAIEPLLEAMEKFYEVIRPIDNIYGVVFDEKKTISLKGKNLNARTIQSNNVDELRTFFSESYSEHLTKGTYLYEGMFLGLDILGQMPAENNKFLVVFSDGEDINSYVGRPELVEMAEGIPNFSAYALDFLKRDTMDPFLMSFSEAHGGTSWKAASASELVPIFQSFADTLIHQYVVSYRFLNPPEGTLALEPETVIIEEVTTIDTSPLLNYVFFGDGKSDIADQYVLFSNSSETRDFSEDKLTDPMEKYRNILNILGKRLSENPDARITIVGCNSNRGQEKGNIDLSRNRAESVQGYLQNTWGIDSSRMEVKARNLPGAPSASKTPEGIAENQRVEVHSDHAAILDIIKSTYVQEVADPKALRIVPQINAEAGVANWKVDLKGEDDTVIESASGRGDMKSAVTFTLAPAGVSKIASFKTLTASVEVTDKDGEEFRTATAATTNVKVIRKEAMRAERKGYHVLEQYALILFEYDSAQLREHNKAIVDRIVDRMKEVPSAMIKIVGHTDNIGSEEYNINLSKRRAKAVYDQIVAAGVTEGENLTYTGVGPNVPLYDNGNPEGRALNRTVTVTLDYDERG